MLVEEITRLGEKNSDGKTLYVPLSSCEAPCNIRTRIRCLADTFHILTAVQCQVWEAF